MTKQTRIAQLEAQIQALFERPFVGLSGRRIMAHDLALQLSREMEAQAQEPHGTATKPIAPDHFVITLAPDIVSTLLDQQPSITGTLSLYLSEMARKSGLYLAHAPVIHIVPDPSLGAQQLVVSAGHQEAADTSTAAMHPVPTTQTKQAHIARLLIDGARVVLLEHPVINIGRHIDNHVVLEDPSVSRHHVQVRRRGQEYLVFNTSSRSVMQINGIQVREHRLRSGDLIAIGQTRMVFMLEGVEDDTATGHLDPV